MKRNLNIFILIGSVLVFTSFVAMATLNISTERSYNQAIETAEIIDSMLPPRTAGMVGIYSFAEMPSLSVEGDDYIALLQIESKGINLPVRSFWDKKEVLASPCCFTGSCYDGSMIIGGSDSQFLFLTELDLGDIICVTDMLGSEFNYEVKLIERSKNAQSEKLINRDYRLTLFARDKQANNYVIVRCKTTV